MDSHKNFAYSTVATAPSPALSGLTLVLAAGGGALMPAVPFNLVVHPASAQPTAANSEVLRVSDVSTDMLTFTRQAESSANRAIVVGDQVGAYVMSKMLDEPTVRDAPLADVFVPAGKTLVVGRGIKIDGVLKVDGEVVSL